jgi:hypothetical protein
MGGGSVRRQLRQCCLTPGIADSADTRIGSATAGLWPTDPDTPRGSLTFRVILVVGIDYETVGAVGGWLRVPEALNQIARSLGQDVGRVLEGRLPENVGLAPSTTAATIPTRINASQMPAARTEIPWVSPEAATMPGVGVSPAAKAAASGSPPGNAAATASAEAGRLRGSTSRQRRITRSTRGSMSFAKEVTLVGVVRWSCFSKSRFPVNISCSTSPRA